MKLTVAYYRSSSELQKNSITTQRDAVEKLAKEQVLPIHEAFTDESQSARKKKVTQRKGMTDLIDLIKRDEVGTLLVYKRDRLARNAIDYMDFYHLCKKHHVSVLFASQNEFPMMYTSLGEFIEVVMAGMVQREAEQLAERISATHQSNFENELRLGRLPYGFIEVTEDGKPVPRYASDQICKDIKLIFEEFLNTRPTDLGEFVRYLNEELDLRYHPYKKKSKREPDGLDEDEETEETEEKGPRYWKPADIVHLLENTLYTGVHSRHFVAGPSTVLRPECKIIEPADWERVQVILAPIKPQQRENPRYTYLLEDLLFCGNCSKGGMRVPLMPKMRHHDGEAVAQYECEKKHFLVAEDCHREVIDYTLACVDQMLKVHGEQVYRDAQLQNQKEIQATIRQHTELLHQKETDFQAAMAKQLLAGLSDPVALQSLETLQKEVNCMRKKLETLHAQLDDCKVIPHIVSARGKYFVHLKEAVVDKLNQRQVKELLQDIISEVWRERGGQLRIVMKFPFLVAMEGDAHARA